MKFVRFSPIKKVWSICSWWSWPERPWAGWQVASKQSLECGAALPQDGLVEPGVEWHHRALFRGLGPVSHQPPAASLGYVSHEYHFEGGLRNSGQTHYRIGQSQSLYDSFHSVLELLRMVSMKMMMHFYIRTKLFHMLFLYLQCQLQEHSFQDFLRSHKSVARLSSCT